MDAALTKIVDALLNALDLFRFWVVLYEYERGVILRLGRFHRELGPGLHWRIPFRVEELRFVNVRRQTSTSWEQTLTTTDASTITVGFDCLIEVRSPQQVLLQMDDWTRVAYNATKITVARAVERVPLKEALNGSFCDDVRQAVEASLAAHGIGLLDFALTERCRSRAYRFFKGSSN